MFRFGFGTSRVVTQVVETASQPIPEITITDGLVQRPRVEHDLSIEFENASPHLTIQPPVRLKIENAGQAVIIQNTGPAIG